MAHHASSLQPMSYVKHLSLANSANYMRGRFTSSGCCTTQVHTISFQSIVHFDGSELHDTLHARLAFMYLKPMVLLLQLDVLAGIAVGFTVVPQSMSYAGIAGVPAVYGLYGAFLPVFTYSIFGSCKQLGVGPVAVTSGLIYSGLNRVIPGYTGITDANDPTPEQAPIQVSGLPASWFAQADQISKKP